MKKTIIIIIYCLFFAVANAATLPSDLQLNITFDYFKLSTDGSTWHNLIASPITINLLDPNTKSTTGESVTMEAIPSGTYKYLGMSVSAIKFSQPGHTDRDILPILKAQNPSMNWSSIVDSIIPFTYHSGQIQFNIYMPISNIEGSGFDNYFAKNGPMFSLSAGSKEAAGMGKVLISIPGGIDVSAHLFLGAFQDMNKDTAPSATGTLINAGDGTATGEIFVLPGSWYLMAIGSDQAIGADGPAEGSKCYTHGGVLPWQGSLAPVTITANETASTTLTYAFTMTSTMGAGGSMQAPVGTASMLFEIEVETPITLAENTELMLYAFTSEAGMISHGSPDYFLDSILVPAGVFSSTTMEADHLAAGNYFVTAFLNVSKTSPGVSGVDYGGGYVVNPLSQGDIITLEANQQLDLTGHPIQITIF